jgi:sulfur-oxidizing protein SoxY
VIRVTRSIPLRGIPVFLLLAGCITATSALAVGEASPTTGAWEYLRPQFYGDREIGVVDEEFMSLKAPANTPDPAATPLTLHFGKGAVGKIRQVRLIIDNNPLPLASTIEIGKDVPVDEIDLRVRIDRFTSARAIAETTDGRLEMRSTWINASGGCSAPPSAAAGGKLGEIRFRPSADDKSLQVSIRHPNHSGFQIDPKTGDPIPPHYVSHIRLSSGGRTLVDVDSGISLSENPTLRIVSDQPFVAPLTLDAVDSKEGHFSATWTGGEPAASGTR